MWALWQACQKSQLAALFVSLVFVSPFVVGYQAMPLLCFYFNFALCRICRLLARQCVLRKIAGLVALYLIVVETYSLGFLGTFNDPEWTAENIGGTLGFAFALSLVFMPFLAIFVFWESSLAILGESTLTKHIKRHPTLTFPLCWVGAQTVLMHVSPIGSFGHQAYTFSSYGPLYQSVSLGGLATVTFMISWGAAVLDYVLELPSNSNSHQKLDTPPASPSPSSDNRKTGSCCTRSRACAGICFLSVLGFVLLYGDVRQLDPSNSFFQISVDYAKRDTVQASCILSLDQSEDTLITRTQEQANLGSKLIVWSEAAITYSTQAEADALIQRVQDIASAKQVYIVCTYYVGTTTTKNMAVLIDDKGKILFSYQKSHPVPGVEEGTKAGPEVIHTADTELFGRIGLAICFDFDFPQFINKAGHQKVDLMIQPSETWGPIRQLHATMDSTRAVENGFNLFRCSSAGVSGVFTPYQKTLASFEALGTQSMIAQLPLGARARTVYGAIGEWLGWTSFSVFIAVFLCLVFLRVQHWRQPAVVGTHNSPML